MMTLSLAPASPFVRKVRLAVRILAVEALVTEAPIDINAPEFRRDFPLGKIPSLKLDDGSALYDSRVILEYLDHRAGGGRIIPSDPAARFPALRLQALADGVMDAAVLMVYEGRYRPPEHKVQSWLDMQSDKVAAALDYLESNPPGLDAPANVGQIALASALGYLDLRFEGAWRKTRPRLTAWLERFADTVPAFAATRAPA